MIGLAFDNLQAPLYTALSGNAGLTALSAEVYDDVPPNATEPYVVIGEYTEIPWDAQMQDGREVTVTLHVWDTQAKRSRQVGNAVAAALQGTTLVVSGFGVARARLEFAQPLREEDPTTGKTIRHLILRFRIRLYEAT